MGKIKQKRIKRTAEGLIREGIEFSEKFEENKRILGDVMPGKKTKNQIAGYLARLKEQVQRKNQFNYTKEQKDLSFHFFLLNKSLISNKF
jgi:ribosomal protein S17E